MMLLSRQTPCWHCSCATAQADRSWSPPSSPEDRRSQHTPCLKHSSQLPFSGLTPFIAPHCLRNHLLFRGRDTYDEAGHLDCRGLGRGASRRLHLRHCTLVPGLILSVDGTPQLPSVPSVVIESTNTLVEIDRCIIGGVRGVDGASVRIADSSADATAETGVACAAPDVSRAGGPLQIKNSTIIGKMHTALMTLASNTILLARLAEPDAQAAPVLIDKRQQGCIRFSSIPDGSQMPRRHRCQPDPAVKLVADLAEQTRIRARSRPSFTSLEYSQPGYGQLSVSCLPLEIRTGAEDSSEMGALSHLKQPQREANSHASLEDSLRFGLEAGVFYVTSGGPHEG